MTTELHGIDFGLLFNETKVLARETSPFQEIVIIETESMGRVMFLDGLVMVTERDECYYHESLVHLASTRVCSLDRVLIIGGGDGGTGRELLKYSVSQLDQVEIDDRVVELSKEFLPTMACSYDDPRFAVHIDDGAAFVAAADDDSYDLVLVDSSEPIGPNGTLFTPEFYGNIRRILRPEGLLSLQAGSPMWQAEELDEIIPKLEGVFDFVSPYTGLTPTYPGGHWTFLLCGANAIPEESARTLPETRIFDEAALAGLLLLGNLQSR